MNKHFQFLILLAVLVFLYAPAGFAQDDEPDATLPSDVDTAETAPEIEATPAGQEVEINEDNYRQFMELKDARQQRNMLPENSYQSQAGAQKIDKLPEESQKHLRNELREIIIQGDPWRSGDEDTDYPYVPSNAASTNPALQKQEADAWGELVGNYHKREADIYANASRSKAASATANATGEGSGDGEGSDGGNSGQGGEGQQASEQNSSKQSSTVGSYSPNSTNDPNAKSTAGISQNAMEFLKGQADGQAQADQQSGAGQNRTASTSSESTSSPSPDESDSDSTAGTSQNALEYLMGNTGDQQDTLTIEDLMNAQGVRNATTAGSPSNDALDDEEDPDKNPPDNGG